METYYESCKCRTYGQVGGCSRVLETHFWLTWGNRSWLISPTAFSDEGQESDRYVKAFIKTFFNIMRLMKIFWCGSKDFCIIETSCVIKIWQKTANLSRKMAAILKTRLEIVFYLHHWICLLTIHTIQCLDHLNMPSYYHCTIKKRVLVHFMWWQSCKMAAKLDFQVANRAFLKK